jgi:hypothetical protein
MDGRVSAIEGAWADERGGCIVLVESEGSNTVAISIVIAKSSVCNVFLR